MIILSVLVPVLPKRYEMFMRLLNELQKQISFMHNNHPDLGLVEILFDNAPGFIEGGKTIGGKRNELRQRAIGKYSLFLDDDELIAPNYIETLVRLCQEDKDVVTYRVLFKSDYYWALLNMSLENKEDEQATPEKIVERRVWHVCAIRTEITLKENFDDSLNHNEDGTWLAKIIPYLHSEAHTNKILLQYNHSELESEADKILKAGFH